MANFTVRDTYKMEVGGGELATIIVLSPQRTLVVAYDMVGVYTSAQTYLDGETPLALHPLDTRD